MATRFSTGTGSCILRYWGIGRFSAEIKAVITLYGEYGNVAKRPDNRVIRNSASGLHLEIFFKEELFFSLKGEI